ncbi:MAG TPA: hypothetical protein PK200_01520 [Spirochaetota bacterium]|nr:hypothetical protein [Spirochaetota bacterium]HQO02974.1 hypothetical protein [Spirochaetota bacterium]HQP50072.1 hypothetical protein [Spirochaetota bacterium]
MTAGGYEAAACAAPGGDNIAYTRKFSPLREHYLEQAPSRREVILDTDDAVWIYQTLSVILDDVTVEEGLIITNSIKDKLLVKLNNPSPGEKIEGIDILV